MADTRRSIPYHLRLRLALAIVTGASPGEASLQIIEYLIAQCEILRAKLPDRIDLTQSERIRLSELARKVHILGITHSPDTPRMVQFARQATWLDGPLAGRKYFIRDNDKLFSDAFLETMQSGPHDVKLKSVPTCIKAPDMNAFAERWVRSLKEECLDNFIFLTEGMLRRAVSGYVDHYNAVRPYQGLDGDTITPWPHGDNTGAIVVDRKLGGVLKSARRLAA